MRAQCPICRGAISPRDVNPAFPFCSERCRLVDLGRWLNEEYRVPDPDDEPAPSGEPDPAAADATGEGR